MTEFENMLDDVQQRERNLEDFEDSRFGEIYLEDEEVVVKQRKVRKFKKEKFYE